jgi:hypothetical protein
VRCDHHCVCVWERRELDVSLGESYLYVRPFGSHNRTFNCYVIDLAIVLSPLPHVFKTQVGTFGDGVYSFESWETGSLLGGFLIVQWRWRWVVQLCLWLGCLRACNGIHYLQRCRRVKSGNVSLSYCWQEKKSSSVLIST